MSAKGIGSILGAPVRELVQAVGGVIGDLHTSQEEKLQAQIRLAELSADCESKLLAAQRDIIVAEAGGEGWLQRNWRPIAMLTFLGIIVYQAVVVGIFNAPPVDVSTIPAEMWELLKIGIGGYIVGRTVEKAVKTYRNGNGSMPN